ncbi:MAG: hypothetical protein ACOYME_13315 [Prochlorotrichaceae cyanobacterium]|jgi:hypothetical protein
MSIQKLSLAGVQKVREHLQQSLLLPELENHPRRIDLDDDQDIPEPGSLDALGDLFRAASLPEEVISAPNTDGRWFVSSVNPGAGLNKVPGLNLKPKYRLVSYLLRTIDSGIGQVWAVPETESGMADLEAVLIHSPSNHNRQLPPRPPQAFETPMHAIEGDRSPTSYVIASVFCRELKEFGALGQDANWSHHRLVASIPQQVKWNWKVEEPRDLSPKVKVYEDGRAAVDFYTCRIVPPVSLLRHLDQYAAQSYIAQSIDRVIAVATR